MGVLETISGILDLSQAISIIKTVLIVLVAYIVLGLLITIIKKKLLSKVKTKKNRSDIEIFSRVLKYILFVFLVLLGISTYSDSWEGLGLGVGLFSAALGWALQKPITGIAGWIMVVLKRPFEIGDRIIIGNVRGDVVDITLTHIYVGEIGGIVAGEESSGRVIMIPNSKLFEQDITNYTHSSDEYVLDQVSAMVTYESDLDKAIKVCIDAAKKELKDIIKETGKEPYARTFFDPNGMRVSIRYFSPATNLQYYSSKITKEIYDMFKKEKKIDFAYPHMQIVTKK